MIRLDNISKQNGHQILFIEASMGVQKGEKVGLVGPNGAGKTTLFRMITGQEQPDSGTFKVGDTVDLAYVDQTRDSLDPEASVYEEITGNVEFMKLGNREVNGRAYVSNAMIDGRFLLRACIVNFRTTEEDLRELIRAIVEIGRAIHDARG